MTQVCNIDTSSSFPTGSTLKRSQPTKLWLLELTTVDSISSFVIKLVTSLHYLSVNWRESPRLILDLFEWFALIGTFFLCKFCSIPIIKTASIPYKRWNYCRTLLAQIISSQNNLYKALPSVITFPSCIQFTTIFKDLLLHLFRSENNIMGLWGFDRSKEYCYLKS